MAGFGVDSEEEGRKPEEEEGRNPLEDDATHFDFTEGVGGNDSKDSGNTNNPNEKPLIISTHEGLADRINLFTDIFKRSLKNGKVTKEDFDILNHKHYFYHPNKGDWTEAEKVWIKFFEGLQKANNPDEMFADFLKLAAQLMADHIVGYIKHHRLQEEKRQNAYDENWKAYLKSCMDREGGQVKFVEHINEYMTGGEMYTDMLLDNGGSIDDLTFLDEEGNEFKFPTKTVAERPGESETKTVIDTSQLTPKQWEILYTKLREKCGEDCLSEANIEKQIQQHVMDRFNIAESGRSYYRSTGIFKFWQFEKNDPKELKNAIKDSVKTLSRTGGYINEKAASHMKDDDALFQTLIKNVEDFNNHCSKPHQDAAWETEYERLQQELGRSAAKVRKRIKQFDKDFKQIYTETGMLNAAKKQLAQNRQKVSDLYNELNNNKSIDDKKKNLLKSKLQGIFPQNQKS